MVNKKDFVILFSVVFLVLVSLNFVSATITVNSPVTLSNNSGTMNISVSTDVAQTTTVWVYYNASGGPIAVNNATTLLVTITNTSLTVVENATVKISHLADTTNLSATYNFTFVLGNSTGNQTKSNLSVTSIRIDNTAPPVFQANITGAAASPTHLGNYSNVTGPQLLTFNISLDGGAPGIGIQTVTFNLTNSTGQVATYVTVNETGNISRGSYANASTFNFSAISDGNYNLTAWVTDYAGNINNSAYISFVIDDDAPAVTLTKNTSTSTSQIVVSVAISGAESGINGACAVSDYGGGTVTFTGTGTSSQILTHTGLSCGVSKSYTVTCNTYTSLSGASSALTVVADACTSSGGGVTSSSGGAAPSATWSNTFVPVQAQLKEGYQKSLAAKERVTVTVGTSSHHVGVKSLSTSSATIEIASDPVEVTLDVGEDAKIDANSDGAYYDIYVKLNAITNGKADVTIKTISEAIPAGAGSVSTTGETATTQNGTTSGTTDSGEKSWTWLWIVIAVIIVLAIVMVSKKRK